MSPVDLLKAPRQKTWENIPDSPNVVFPIEKVWKSSYPIINHIIYHFPIWIHYWLNQASHKWASGQPLLMQLVEGFYYRMDGLIIIPKRGQRNWIYPLWLGWCLFFPSHGRGLSQSMTNFWRIFMRDSPNAMVVTIPRFEVTKAASVLIPQSDWDDVGKKCPLKQVSQWDGDHGIGFTTKCGIASQTCFLCTMDFML